VKLALGTVQFGMDYGINNPRGKIPEKEVFEILSEAERNAINTLDTAHAYGESERLIGEYIKDKGAVFRVVSKLPPCGPEEAERVFYTSLERLRLDRLYGCLIHDFASFLKTPEIWEILKRLKAERKTGRVGFSLYYPEELEYLLEEKIEMDLVQVPFSVLDQRFLGRFPLLKDRGVEVHVRSVFLQGLLFMNPRGLKGNLSRAKDKLFILRTLSEQAGIPLSAICINFALLNDFIDRVIIGVDGIRNLSENLRALSYQDEVRDMYGKLLDLKEDDEDVILPSKWDKQEVRQC
jgi:aryl-alcohol dehydrogenase-like predicted oxidoreductase